MILTLFCRCLLAGNRGKLQDSAVRNRKSLELQPHLERDHAGSAVATQTHAQQAGRQAVVGRERSESNLG
jgi:hypothetical protein